MNPEKEKNKSFIVKYYGYVKYHNHNIEEF